MITTSVIYYSLNQNIGIYNQRKARSVIIYILTEAQMRSFKTLPILLVLILALTFMISGCKDTEEKNESIVAVPDTEFLPSGFGDSVDDYIHYAVYDAGTLQIDGTGAFSILLSDYMYTQSNETDQQEITLEILEITGTYDKASGQGVFTGLAKIHKTRTANFGQTSSERYVYDYNMTITGTIDSASEGKYLNFRFTDSFTFVDQSAPDIQSSGTYTHTITYVVSQ